MANQTITEYWRENYVDKDHCLCVLCGNTGIVDTRVTAVSHAGVTCGKVAWCICPNGQGFRDACEAEPSAMVTSALVQVGAGDIDNLRKFYDVVTLLELVTAQALHVERLQAKLPPTTFQFYPKPVRGG